MFLDKEVDQQHTRSLVNREVDLQRVGREVDTQNIGKIFSLWRG